MTETTPEPDNQDDGTDPTPDREPIHNDTDTDDS